MIPLQIMMEWSLLRLRDMKLAIERRKREAQDLDNCSFSPNLITQGSQKGQSKHLSSFKDSSNSRSLQQYNSTSFADTGRPRPSEEYYTFSGDPVIRKNDYYISSRSNADIDESTYPDFVGGRSYSAYPPTATPSRRTDLSSGNFGNDTLNGSAVAQYDVEDDDDYCGSGSYELNESGDVVLSTTQL